MFHDIILWVSSTKMRILLMFQGPWRTV
jgi:hypothetical protein